MAATVVTVTTVGQDFEVECKLCGRPLGLCHTPDSLDLVVGQHTMLHHAVYVR